MIPPSNHHDDARALHMEILDATTREVWQTMTQVTLADYRALEIEPAFSKVGLGSGAMDASWFSRSPGADQDGPMQTQVIGGHVFSLCARPDAGGPARPWGADGPVQLLVDKHHVLAYRAGREIPLIRLPDGSDYVHVIEGGPDKKPLELPAGWGFRTQTLERDIVVELPAPTLVFFFPNRDSFQGPVDTSGW